MSKEVNYKKSATKVPLEIRKKLIQQQKCFEMLSGEELNQLAELAFEKNFGPNEVIVYQGDYIDAVYLVVKGEIEVVSEVDEAGKMRHVVQAVLREGNSIGLSKVSFFSKSGIRTTTLTSLSNVLLIGWRLLDLYNFLQEHPIVGNAMQEAAKLILRMNFVKQVTLFSSLPAHRIAEVAQNIKEINVPKDTVLFREGEKGDECYLVNSGKVEVLVHNDDGTEKSLAILESPAMFGEIAPLTDSPRNATARMKEAGNLFVLQKTQLNELLQHQASTAESIVTLMVERSRPLRYPFISYYHRTTSDGRTITILKNTKYWRYYLLSNTGWLIWQQLDGRQTIEDIIMVLLKEYKVFAPEEVPATILNLANSGFISLPAMGLISTAKPSEEDTPLQRFKSKVLKKFYFRHIFEDIDKNLTASYRAGIYLLFNPVSQGFFAMLAFIGVICFFLFGQSAGYVPSLSQSLIILGSIFLANLLLVPLHELGHAYTTKALGHEIHRAGLIFFFVGLVAFVDTTDMCLSDKKSRVLVYLSGPYTDLWVAGIASLCAVMITIPALQLFFWLLALLLYFSALKNLNPINEGDGYHVVSDILDKSKLYTSSFSWLKKLKLKSITTKSFFTKNKAEIIFWSVSFLFLLISVGLTIFAQHILLHFAPKTLFGISTYVLSWIFPVLVVCRFFLKIWLTLKKLRV